MRFPPVDLPVPPGWLLVTPGDDAADDAAIDPAVAAHLADIAERQPGTVLLGWLGIPLENDADELVDAIYASAYGAWVEGRVLPPDPMREPVYAPVSVYRSVDEQPISIGGVESVWLQAAYSFPDLAPGATFMLVLSTPNIPLADMMTDYFDRIARLVRVPVPAAP